MDPNWPKAYFLPQTIKVRYVHYRGRNVEIAHLFFLKKCSSLFGKSLRHAESFKKHVSLNGSNNKFRNYTNSSFHELLTN